MLYSQIINSVFIIDKPREEESVPVHIIIITGSRENPFPIQLLNFIVSLFLRR